MFDLIWSWRNDANEGSMLVVLVYLDFLSIIVGDLFHSDAILRS